MKEVMLFIAGGLMFTGIVQQVQFVDGPWIVISLLGIIPLIVAGVIGDKS